MFTGNWMQIHIQPIQHNPVGGIPTPLENMSSSVGVTIPNICKNKNVPNHQNMQLDLTSTMNGLMGISSIDGQTKHMVYKDK